MQIADSYVQKSQHSVNAKKSNPGLPILLVKSELRTEPTLTMNQPNLEPTLTPNQPKCSEEHGGSNNYYLTDFSRAVDEGGGVLNLGERKLFFTFWQILCHQFLDLSTIPNWEKK